MSAKMMATLVAVLILLVDQIPATYASLPYGGRKILWLDGSTKTVPRLQGISEGLNITSKKIVFFRSLRARGLSPPPSPARNRPITWTRPEPKPEPKPAPPPPQIQ